MQGLPSTVDPERFLYRFGTYWWFRYLVYACLLLGTWLRPHGRRYRGLPDVEMGPTYSTLGVAVGVAVLLMLVWRLSGLRKPVEEQSDVPDLIGLILSVGFSVYSFVLYAQKLGWP